MSGRGADRHPLTFLDQDFRLQTATSDPRRPAPGPPADPPPPIGGRTADPPPGLSGQQLEDFWARAETIGRLTGHVVVRCPSCQNRAMASIVNTSGTSRWVKSGGGWPKCKQCRAAPRTEPVGDVTLVARIKPGHMATAREVTRYRRRLEQESALPTLKET
jgi:hypothetical protein